MLVLQRVGFFWIFLDGFSLELYDSGNARSVFSPGRKFSHFDAEIRAAQASPRYLKDQKLTNWILGFSTRSTETKSNAMSQAVRQLQLRVCSLSYKIGASGQR